MVKLSEYLSRKDDFSRGNIKRAKRDVLVRRLAGKKGVRTPFALATYMIKKGVKVGEAGERRLGHPRSEAERKKRHKRLTGSS